MDLSWLYGVPNISFFDSYWAVVHFVNGALLGLLLLYLNRKKGITALVYARLGFSLLLAWEYFEVLLRLTDRYHLPLRQFAESILPHSFFEIESTVNIISDLIMGSLGLYLAYRYWRPRQNREP